MLDPWPGCVPGRAGSYANACEGMLICSEAPFCSPGLSDGEGGVGWGERGREVTKEGRGDDAPLFSPPEARKGGAKPPTAKLGSKLMTLPGFSDAQSTFGDTAAEDEVSCILFRDSWGEIGNLPVAPLSSPVLLAVVHWGLCPGSLLPPASSCCLLSQDAL